MFSFNHRGSFDNLESFLKSMQKLDIYSMVKPYAEEGVFALSAATPSLSGLAASSWSYEIYGDDQTVTIVWTNDNVEYGLNSRAPFPVVIKLQYGYVTGTGGFVQGRDFINPAMKPIFDRISDGVWKVVKSA